MSKIISCLTSVTVVFMLIGFSTGFVQAGPCELPDFGEASFYDPVSNPYLSINNIGNTYVYEAEEDDELIRDYIYFTGATVNFEGVDWVVVYDVEYLWVEDHPLGARWVKLEETDDWHAWDNIGNFWYGGEDTVEYFYDDNWAPAGSSTEGSWQAGVDGAEPGIILLANPKVGECVQQEYYEDEAEDRGRVLRLNAKVSVEYEGDDPDGEYENCEMTKEFTPLDPGNIEHKYYCRVGDGPEDGRGLVYIEELKEKTVIFELVDILIGSGPPAVPPDPSP